MKAIEARGLPVPPMYGLLIDDREKTNEQIIAEFDAFIRTRLGPDGPAGKMFRSRGRRCAGHTARRGALFY